MCTPTLGLEISRKKLVCVYNAILSILFDIREIGKTLILKIKSYNKKFKCPTI
jgi:hypothetical protein